MEPSTPPRPRRGGASGLRVALDSSFLVLNRASGTRTYTLNLARALLETGDLGLVAFYLYWRGPGERVPLPGARERVVRLPRRLVEAAWERLALPPVDWFTGPVDVYHSVHLLVPPQARGASVLTLHDLREYRLPELFPGLQSFRAPRAAMARRAHRLVAISESTRRDAIECMGVEPSRVRVVPNGLDARFLEPVDPARGRALRARLSLERPFVLFLSSRDPRKGFQEACEAFALASGRGLSGFDFVVAGALPGDAARVLRSAGPSERVRVVGMVDDADLVPLLGEARALLFPSRYEGFGLPLLEAMACGTPVVACQNSCIPEVAGEAALLVPTGDVGGLAEALQRLEEDAALRERLVERGRVRCREFTWERTARAMVEVYREAALEAR